MRSSLWKNANSTTAVPEATNGAGCRVLTCPGRGDLGIPLFRKWKPRPRGEKWLQAHRLGGSRIVENFWEEAMSPASQEGAWRLLLTLGGHKSEGSVHNGRLHRSPDPVSVCGVPTESGMLLGAGERTDHDQNAVLALPHSGGKHRV